MIYPALVMKVVSIHGNTMSVQFDDGKVANIECYGNDKTLNSLQEYLVNKALKGVKKNKVQNVQMALLSMEDSPYDTSYEKAKKAEISQMLQNSGEANPMKAAQKVAEQIVYNTNLIQPGSIIRMAVSYNEKSGALTTRSIISKEGQYTTTGIYNQSVIANHIPIEIKRNDRGYIVAETSMLIRMEHVQFLLSHLISTALNNQKAGYAFRAPFIKGAPFKIPYGKENDPQTMISYYLQLKEYIFANPAILKTLRISVPVYIDNNIWNKILKEGTKSPVAKLPAAAVNLNFSKENPDTKAALTNLAAQLTQSMEQNLDKKILTTYNIQYAGMPAEVTSWGFMDSNVDSGKLTFEKAGVHSLLSRLKQGV